MQFQNALRLILCCFAAQFALCAGARSQTIDQPAFPAPQVGRLLKAEAVSPDRAPVAAGKEKLVYSNTLGMTAVAFGAGRLVADDVFLTCVGDCRLTRLEFPVVGRVDPAGPGGAYSISIAIYDTCPYALNPAASTSRVVAGTSALVEVPDDEPRLISIDYSQVLVPTVFWLAVTFSRDNAGPVFGAPSSLGFSDDVFDYPGFPCQANFGGFPTDSALHSSMNVQIWAAAFTEAQLGYSFRNESGIQWPMSVGQWVVDDVNLRLQSCRMIGYSVAVRGPGTYNFEFRPTCGGQPWVETAKTQIVGQSSGANPRVFHYALVNPIDVPRHMWFAVKVNSVQAGPVAISGTPVIGSNNTYFNVQDAEGNCVSVFDGYREGLQVTVFCEGAPAVGACCDPFLTECRDGATAGQRCQSNADCVPPGTCEAVCRELSEYNCGVYFADDAFKPRWQAGDACDPSPFSFPCGVSACCMLDEACENLTENQCNEKQPIDAPREWQLGEFCWDDGQVCPYGSCEEEDLHCPVGNCAAEWKGSGCIDLDCKASICQFDPWCCDVEWDAPCVVTYQEFRFCDVRPLNDDCYRSNYPRPRTAQLVSANSSTIFSNLNAEKDEDGVGFTCFDAPSICIGGNRSGLSCDDHTDCPSAGGFAECVDSPSDRNQHGYRPVWFRFVASHSTARVHTCSERSVVRDTVVEVFEAEDTTSLQASCNTLLALACSARSDTCADGLGADLTLTQLEPGREYFVKVGGNALYAATDSDVLSGIIQLDVESPSPMAAMAVLPPSAASAAEGPALRQPKAASVSIMDQQQHSERLHDPPAKPVLASSPPAFVERNGYVSVQVNVDEFGNNILGDAANEPSLAINPLDPKQIVIGWRQFDSIESDFRQAGYAYSHDGGLTWTFPGVLDPGVFRSDPVLDSGPQGEIYFNSIDDNFVGTLFVSTDGGVNWESQFGVGGDKPWFIVDKARGTGVGNLYGMTRNATIERFVPEKGNWEAAYSGLRYYGTIAVGNNGLVYLVSDRVAISKTARLQGQPIDFPLLIDPFESAVALGGTAEVYPDPNPGGLLGQPWIATEPKGGLRSHNVYVLDYVYPHLGFARSVDGGRHWSKPVYVNDDWPSTAAWHWFGTMCVAPTGRIDVFWNDTRNTGDYRLSQLFYSHSIDEGRTWSANIPVSPVWNSHVGWPHLQAKIGDYYHCVSDAHAANLAYAATFNGEQDVYFLRLEPDIDCNQNGIIDRLEVKEPGVADCDGDWVPDDCENDTDGDGIIDGCDGDMDGDGVDNDADVCFVNGAGATVAPDGRPLADTNQDCFVDRSDYQRWLRCTQADAPSACFAAFDLDQDGALSLADFAAFQRSFQIPQD